MNLRLILLVALLLSILGRPMLAISEETPEARIVYRLSTLKSLVSESQREKAIPSRQPQKKSTSPNNISKTDPLELEPPSSSFGNVVGA